jgi:hypothetical protein
MDSRMKLFCKNKDEVVKVQIVKSGLPWSYHFLRNVQGQAEKPRKPRNYELGLKVAALIAVIVNSALACIGYVDFTGQLETLGISTNEIELGLPTLLLQGYFSTVVSSLEYAADHALGLLLILAVPVLAAYIPVSRYLEKRDLVDRFAVCMMLTLLFLTISIVPVIGLRHGELSAYETYSRQNKPQTGDVIVNLARKKTITTKDNKIISGETVFASTLYTYILQGPELYKIANRDNHIVSVTTIDPVVVSQVGAKNKAAVKPNEGS